MAEYICREETINAIKNLESSMLAKDNYAKGYDAALGRTLIAVREVPPAADVQPVKHGKWIAENRDNRGYADCYTCTNCNCCTYTYTLMKDCEHDYCPNCGARMDIIYEDDKVRAIKVAGWSNYCGECDAKMDGDKE